jgi:hypothetical protein
VKLYRWEFPLEIVMFILHDKFRNTLNDLVKEFSTLVDILFAFGLDLFIHLLDVIFSSL